MKRFQIQRLNHERAYGIIMRIIKKENKNMSPNKYQFNVKFNKCSHSLGVETYAKTLLSLESLIKETSYQLDHSLPDVSLEVSAENEGSFDALVQIVSAATDPNILTLFESLPSVLGAVLDIIEIKKALTSNPDASVIKQEDGAVLIQNSENVTIKETTINNYYIYSSNQVANDAISEQFKALASDDDIESIDIGDKNTHSTFTKDDFEPLSRKRTVESEDTDTSTTSAALTICKLSLDNKNAKWNFIYNGNRIAAKIKDDQFWDKVLSGEESFANGEKLVVDLDIKREYDPTLNVFINKDYSIAKVRDHQSRSQSQQLDFTDI